MHHHSLTDPNIPLIVDTSVIINLVASGIPEQILANISNPIYIVDAVLPELNSGNCKGRRDAEVLGKLLRDNIVSCVSLNDQAWEQFGQMVSGRAKTSLDDGEAATLAYCAIHNTVPVIDERKANNFCKENYQYLKPISSAAMFRIAEKPMLKQKLSISEAVFNALTMGRMFVMPHHLDWIVKIIGPEKAVNYNSISKRSRRFLLPTA